MGIVTKVIDPLGNEENYEYDEIGNIISKTDYDGFMTRYDYDTESNLTGIQYADGKAVKMSYNPLKQLVEIQDWLGVTTIVPDALGRALKVTDYANRTVEYEWGAMGERKSMTYPNGKRVDYSYNEKGQLEQLLDEMGAVRYGYDEHSRLEQKLYPNGAKANYSYNTMGNLAGIVNYSGQNATDILEFSYDKAAYSYRLALDCTSVTRCDSHLSYFSLFCNS